MVTFAGSNSRKVQAASGTCAEINPEWITVPL